MMTKEEKEKLLREAVLSLNPQKIREAGEKTGHPVKVSDDGEVIQLASEMIVFYIPNAPKEIMMTALSMLTMDMFGNIKFGNMR